MFGKTYFGGTFVCFFLQNTSFSEKVGFTSEPLLRNDNEDMTFLNVLYYPCHMQSRI